jgi:hypothetical protein
MYTLRFEVSLNQSADDREVKQKARPSDLQAIID